MKIMLIAFAWFAITGVGAQTGKPAVLVSAMDVSCTGQTDGRLDFTLSSGAVPVVFQWTNLSSGASGNGQFAQIGQSAALTNLLPGLYRLTFVASDGADTSVERTIKTRHRSEEICFYSRILVDSRSLARTVVAGLPCSRP